MLSVGVANTKATCLDYEYLHFSPPSGQTCGNYLSSYIKIAGGYVENPNATDTCSFCQISDTNVFLNAVGAHYSDRWRNFGIMWGYVIFNICAALFLYWLVRVPKSSKETKEMSGPLTGTDVDEKKETSPAPNPFAEEVDEKESS
jgi:ATP-binding cassette, subfamily G (WHITE), member 2, PDR